MDKSVFDIAHWIVVANNLNIYIKIGERKIKSI